MITLRNKLYESLLDDEEELINTGDEDTILNDKNNQFYNFFKSRGSFGQYVDDIPTIKSDKLIYPDTVLIIGDNQPIKYYLPNIKTIRASRVQIDSNNEEISKHTLCHNIEAKLVDIYIMHTNIIKDISINLLDDKNQADQDYILSGISIKNGNSANKFLSNYKTITFNNVKLKSKNKCIISISYANIPKFVNCEFNCKELHISLMTKDVLSDVNIAKSIDQHLDMDYSFDVLNMKSKEIETKNKMKLKSLRMLVGNLIYKPQQSIGRFKPNTKITDIFEDIPQNVSEISISDHNDTRILFSKSPQPHNSFKINEYVIPLSDGWYMELWRSRAINTKYRG